MKKKIMTTLLSTIIAMGLMACGSNSSSNSQSDYESTKNTESEEIQNKEESEKETSDAKEITSDNDKESGNVLVVYYSASGNTKAVAEIIAKNTEGDLFELAPTEIYTDEDLDWTKSDSRVSVEHDDESKREVSLTAETVHNWSEYDIVYIGYPIWWGIAAWPVDNFVKSNDFTGKTVIPFATAASSGLGESGELLEEMAGTGEWLEGECFRGKRAEKTIKEWLNSLELN